MRTTSVLVRGAGILAAVGAGLAALDLAGTGDGSAFVASQVAILPAAVALGLAVRRRSAAGGPAALLGIASCLVGALLGDAAPTAPAWLLLEAAWTALVAMTLRSSRPGLAMLAALVATAAGLGLVRAILPVPFPLGSVVGVRAALTVGWLAWVGAELTLLPKRAGGSPRPSRSGSVLDGALRPACRLDP